MLQRFSVRLSTLGDDLRAAIPLARAIGYGGVQIDIASPTHDLSELSVSGAREFRHLLTRERLELGSLRTQLPPESLMRPSDLDRVIWFLDRALQTAAALACPTLSVSVGRLPPTRIDTRPPKPITPGSAGLIIIPEAVAPALPADSEGPADESAWTGIDEILREIGARADRYGALLAFESELSSFASLRRMLQAPQCPWFGVDLDPVSVLQDRWDIEQVLDTLGSQLRHVRARDAIKGNAGRTQPAPIGRGATDWRQLLSLLDAGAYSGWISVDTMDLPDRLGEAQRALATLGIFGHSDHPL